MQNIILLILSLLLTNSVALAADYYANPTVSVQLNIKNNSNYPYGNSRGNIYLFAQSMEGNVALNDMVLAQPEDATVEYLLQAIGKENKICVLTITTSHGLATATVKNLKSFNHCKVTGDPNGLNFNFIIN
jgi:hypothetical protein